MTDETEIPDLVDITDLVNDKMLRPLVIAGHLVPSVNLFFTVGEDIAEMLAARAPFAVAYYDTAEAREFILRSRDFDGVDVGKIAAEFGGEGTAQCAHFSCSVQTAQGFEIFDSPHRIKFDNGLSEVREIFAGMEGFSPDTDKEKYLLRIINQMYGVACHALTGGLANVH